MLLRLVCVGFAALLVCYYVFFCGLVFNVPGVLYVYLLVLFVCRGFCILWRWVALWLFAWVLIVGRRWVVFVRLVMVALIGG